MNNDTNAQITSENFKEQNQKQKKRSEPTEKSDTRNKKNEVYYKKTMANHMMKEIGEDLLANMSEDDRAIICSKSDDLYFLNLLGTASVKKKRKVGSKKNNSIEYKTISSPIGVTLQSKTDIEVPFLKDVTKNNKIGITPIEDFEYKIVKANEDFHLTLYEFMFLMIQPEYSGKLRVLNKDFYAYLSLKLPAYKELYNVADELGYELKRKRELPINELPTPTIIFENDNGSARENMVDIDEKEDNDSIPIEDRKWIPTKEYERFAPLIKNKSKKRPSKQSSSSTTDSSFSKAPKHQLISLALQERFSSADSVSSQTCLTEEDLLNRGNEILNSMDANRREIIGGEFETLKFVNVLAIENFEKPGEYKKIGFTMLSEKEIQIPIIDMLKNDETGFDIAKDVSYRTVAAGVPFHVTKYEWMYLLIRDEYSGSCVYENNGDPLILQFKVERYLKGDVKLPAISFEKSKTSRLDSIFINYKDEDGIERIREEYIRFALLLEG